MLVSVAATSLAAIGILMEQTGLASLTTGELVVGLWCVYMGVLDLFVAVYLLGLLAGRPSGQRTPGIIAGVELKPH